MPSEYTAPCEMLRSLCGRFFYRRGLQSRRLGFRQKTGRNSTIFVNYRARPDLPGLSRLARSASSLAPLRQAVPLRLIQPTIRPYLYPPKRVRAEIRTLPGLGPARHPPHCRVLARSPRPFRAPFEPSKTACPRSWPCRGSSPSKRPTAGKSGSGVHPVPPGRAPGRQRQHRQMAWVVSANPAEPIASPFRAHFVRAMARVHEYPDGQLAIFHGPHRLAEYGPDGSPRDDAKLAA